jgi:SAM-dependent methyltransferase
VDSQTADLLLQLNQQFYSNFASQFSATRQRLQPGVSRFLATIPAHANLLDLGCGNGELARALAASGHAGSYTGLDFSAELLQEAREKTPPGYPARYFQINLAAAWEAPLGEASFDVVLAFAVLHHIPGAAFRQQFLANVSAWLRPGGRFTHSNWQFLQSPRLRARIQPWSRLDIPESAVDPGDYLLDWRRGGYGLRYVHYFSEAELGALAGQAGFSVLDTYYADGASGRLGLYQTWKKNAAA